MKPVDLTELKSLEALIYEPVKVTTTEGKIYEGEFTTYTRADDNISGLESIGMEYGDHIESFDITFIKSIEILEEQDRETPVLNIVKERFPSRKLPQEVIQAIELLDSYLAQSSVSAH